MDKIIIIKASKSLKDSIICAFNENDIKGTNYQMQNLEPFIVGSGMNVRIFHNNKTIIYKKNRKWEIDNLLLSNHGVPKKIKDNALLKDAKVIIFGY